MTEKTSSTTTVDPMTAERADVVEALAEAVRPLLERTGAHLVPAGEARADDLALEWRGDPVLHVRFPTPSGAVGSEGPGDLSDGLVRLIAEVEKELGGALAHLPRAGKQRAVRLLEERGAFEMRKSAETVAEALGVTRFTVYNYLNRG